MPPLDYIHHEAPIVHNQKFSHIEKTRQVK